MVTPVQHNPHSFPNTSMTLGDPVCFKNASITTHIDSSDRKVVTIHFESASLASSFVTTCNKHFALNFVDDDQQGKNYAAPKPEKIKNIEIDHHPDTVVQIYNRQGNITHNEILSTLKIIFGKEVVEKGMAYHFDGNNPHESYGRD